MNGTGLSTGSDVLLRWVDINGTPQMVQLSPSTAAADGSSATLVLPDYANGAFSLQVLGSATQPLLQIVPTLSSIDVQDRTVLFGSGFVEGAGIYNFAGASVADSAGVGNDIDVYYSAGNSAQNGSAYLNRNALPAHGLGNVTVTTAGGTSAALALNSVRRERGRHQPGRRGRQRRGQAVGGRLHQPGPPAAHRCRPTGRRCRPSTLTAAFGTPYMLQLPGAAGADRVR